LTDVFEAHFQERFDFFRFLCYFDSELVASRLEQCFFNVDVDLRVSYALVTEELFDVPRITGDSDSDFDSKNASLRQRRRV
jgi:hypothetical protein